MSRARTAEEVDREAAEAERAAQRLNWEHTPEAKLRREAANREQVKRDWADPAAVQRAARSLDGHPLRAFLGGMLAGLIQRHAPQNLGYLPPEFLLDRRA